MLKMMQFGGLSGLENPLRVLSGSRAKQETFHLASWLQGDHPLLSITETCGCTILSFKESLTSPRTPESLSSSEPG